MAEEIRTASRTGGEKGVKAQRYDLLPKEGLDAIAEVYGFGASKYADHNWRKGYEWSKSYAALQRHLQAFWNGETYDPESGLEHLGHAGFHILVLLTWLRRDGEGSEFDDRWVNLLGIEVEEGEHYEGGVADGLGKIKVDGVFVNGILPRSEFLKDVVNQTFGEAVANDIKNRMQQG